jgi:hypothetical protein
MTIRKWRTMGAVLLFAVVLAWPALVRAEGVLSISEVVGTPALGGAITVRITGLANWNGKHDICKAVLYLAEQQLKGVYPRDCQAKGGLQFGLKRTDQLKDAWAAILGAPDGFTRKVTVAVGFEDNVMLASGGSVELTLIRTDWVFWVLLSFFTLAVGLFFWLLWARWLLMRARGLPRLPLARASRR